MQTKRIKWVVHVPPEELNFENTPVDQHVANTRCKDTNFYQFNCLKLFLSHGHYLQKFVF